MNCIDSFPRKLNPSSIGSNVQLGDQVSKALDYTWTQISLGGEAQLYEGCIKKLKKERLKKLPDIQMKRIGKILDDLRSSV